MKINHNLAALNIYRNQQQSTKVISNSFNKLASGQRINQAADDAAGLAISEKMRGQIRGLEKAKHNIQDGISLVQTAEAALGQINDPHLQRLRELAVQASNDTLTQEDRQQIQLEVDQLKEGIDFIANHTEFNTIKLLNRVPGTGESSGVAITNGSEKPLTNTIDYDTQPSWQANKIAFNRGGDIYIMNTDGSGPRLAVNNASQPALSPDGSMIAYVRPDKNLYVAAIDGTGERQLTTTADLHFDSTFGSRLTWSPSGEAVYFKAENKGIESVNLSDGSRLIVSHDTSAASPSISPDGKTMVFQATGGIYSIQVDSTDLQNLVSSGEQPRFSPDGKLIAFSAVSTATNDTELFIMNSDGTNVNNITGKMDTASLHNHNIYPEWSPDGNYIVFHSDNVANPSTGGDIWRVELGGATTDNVNHNAPFHMRIQTGANVGQNVSIALTDARTSALGIHQLSVLSREDAEKAIGQIDNAMKRISAERSRFGVYQNVLEHVQANVESYGENMVTSESRIRDVDMAKEQTKLVGHQIVLQASQSMMAQANQVMQGILQVLK
ncbi:flagellin [Sporosarcina luteola]|nr:flagellin [Sporosarcina luteola]